MLWRGFTYDRISHRLDHRAMSLLQTSVAVHSLTIVIPALNEEEAIGATISRCLTARSSICQQANLKSVEVVVVSDGSTDQTAEIAQGFADVKVIVFPKNRGYGAAIKEGFAQGRGTLVGFLDADGTCDPETFGPLCMQLQAQGADIVLGSRMGPGSQMPRVRRLGNRVYALILGFLCGQAVSDTASGMRVIRRSSLTELYPLPDGLHFTPSMSARALLSGMKITEVSMTYAERIGESKLHVFRDGVRFLRTIIEGVLCFRPERLFLLCFTACFLAAILLAAYPIEFYLQHRALQEWMIYRSIVCYLLGSVGFICLAGGTLAHKMAASTTQRPIARRFWPSLFEAGFSGWPFAVFVSFVTLTSAALVWSGVVEYLSTGEVTLHWSRVMTSAFGFLVATIACITAVLIQVINVRQRQESLQIAQSPSARPDAIEYADVANSSPIV